MQKGSSSVWCVCVCVVGGAGGFVDVYGAWQVEKGESKSRNIKKLFFLYPKEDMWEKKFIFLK